MSFPARFAGLCVACSRPYPVGAEITTTTPHEVVPARFRHAGRCPAAPPALPGRDHLAEHARAHAHRPLRVRALIGGEEIELVVTGRTAEMLRFTPDGISISPGHAALCDQRPEPAPGARRSA